MSVIVKELEPEDTKAKMEMERALAKLKLGPKKDPNELLDEFASIECRYLLELSKSKKKNAGPMIGWNTVLKYHCNHQQ